MEKWGTISVPFFAAGVFTLAFLLYKNTPALPTGAINKTQDYKRKDLVYYLPSI